MLLIQALGLLSSAYSIQYLYHVCGAYLSDKIQFFNSLRSQQVFICLIFSLMMLETIHSTVGLETMTFIVALETTLMFVSILLDELAIAFFAICTVKITATVTVKAGDSYLFAHFHTSYFSNY